MKKETRQNIIFWFSVVSTLLSTLALFSLMGLEAYVRWSINQNFTFLGDSGLLGLSLLVLGQIALLAYIHRQDT